MYNICSPIISALGLYENTTNDPAGKKIMRLEPINVNTLLNYVQKNIKCTFYASQNYALQLILIS